MSNCSPELILDYLNRARVRCTYMAFADVLGVPVRSAGRHLGDHRPYASRVVARSDGDRTEYAEHDKHLELCRSNHVIKIGEVAPPLHSEGHHGVFRNQVDIAPRGRLGDR